MRFGRWRGGHPGKCGENQCIYTRIHPEWKSMRTLGLALVRDLVHGEVDCGLPCRASLTGISRWPSAHLHERQPPGHSSSFIPNGLSWPCCLKFMGILSRQFLCESSLHSSRETPFIVSLPTTGKFLKKRDKEGSNKGHDFVSRWILSCGEEKIALEWEGRRVNVYLTSCP